MPPGSYFDLMLCASANYAAITIIWLYAIAFLSCLCYCIFIFPRTIYAVKTDSFLENAYLLHFSQNNFRLSYEIVMSQEAEESTILFHLGS